MCGIIHCKLAEAKRLANKLVIKRYHKQKSRGQQGYGYVELKNGFVVAEVRTQNEKEILEKLKESTADEIMFHHRFPTSTPNIIEATHPIKVSNPCLEYNYYVIHNGIISNDDILRAEHLKNGFAYTTEITKKWITLQNTYEESMWNDSEALAIDLALAIESGKAIEANGSIAFIALQYEKISGKAIALYYGRNEGNPLCLESDKNFFSLSSESGKKIEADTLYRYDYETTITTREVKKIGTYYSYAGTTYGYGYSTDEEDDFDIKDYESMQAIEDKLEKAYQESDYDLIQDLEWELEAIEIKCGRKSPLCT